MRRAEGHSRSCREPAVPHPIGCNNICQCPLSPGAGGGGGGAAIWVHTAKGNASSHTTTGKPLQQTHIPTIEGFSSIKVCSLLLLSTKHCNGIPQSPHPQSHRLPACTPSLAPRSFEHVPACGSRVSPKSSLLLRRGTHSATSGPCAHIQLSVL